MMFDNIPIGSAVFVDANTFIYAFDADPRYGRACEQLLLRIENQQLQGFTSAHVVGEVAHRVMTIEAANLHHRPLKGMANWLRRHPAEVQRLSHNRRVIDEMTLCRVTVLPVTGSLVSLAADLTPQYGLLSNDALIVVVMRDRGITHLASLDADFDRVPGITRYSPI